MRHFLHGRSARAVLLLTEGVLATPDPRRLVLVPVDPLLLASALGRTLGRAVLAPLVAAAAHQKRQPT
jgi:hypothetical protein